MDTSPEYIKMCEKAQEIQALRPILDPPSETDANPRIGSYFYSHQDKQVFILHWDNDCGRLIIGEYHKPDLKELLIWIPRQDQLQAMLTEDDYAYAVRHMLFADSGPITFIDRVCLKTAMSFEVIWLCWVMFYLFGKKWDGAAWVPIEI